MGHPATYRSPDRVRVDQSGDLQEGYPTLSVHRSRQQPIPSLTFRFDRYRVSCSERGERPNSRHHRIRGRNALHQSSLNGRMNYAHTGHARTWISRYYRIFQPCLQRSPFGLDQRNQHGLRDFRRVCSGERGCVPQWGTTKARRQLRLRCHRICTCLRKLRYH